MGGFQLLDLHDFPGQGTALVGVLNAFWEDKGYVSGKEYSNFCNATVPLVRFPKMVYLNNETLSLPVEIAHFGKASITNVITSWTVKDVSGKILFAGRLPVATIPPGNGFKLGTINQSLQAIDRPSKLILTVGVGTNKNTWDFFVYPAQLPSLDYKILVTQGLDANTLEKLNQGRSVLLTLKKGVVKKDKGGDIAIGFSSIFWNTAWTNRQAPHTLGILCDTKHPAFSEFPTDYYSNLQWWDGMSHSNAIMLDSIAKGIQPIVRVIDDWVSARSLGVIFELKVGSGKLLVSSIDLISDQALRPDARQLLYSLEKYMNSNQFNPRKEASIEKIKDLVNAN